MQIQFYVRTPSTLIISQYGTAYGRHTTWLALHLGFVCPQEKAAVADLGKRSYRRASALQATLLRRPRRALLAGLLRLPSHRVVWRRQSRSRSGIQRTIQGAAASAKTTNARPAFSWRWLKRGQLGGQHVRGECGPRVCRRFQRKLKCIQPNLFVRTRDSGQDTRVDLQQSQTKAAT